MSILAVACPLGQMNATGSGYVEKQQLTTASHLDITHEFVIDASAGAALFTAFSWQDVNTEGSVDASAGETDFTVSLDADTFKTALQSVIENATGRKLGTVASIVTSSTVPAITPGALGSSAQYVIDREIRGEIETALNNNGVLEYLEGDALGNFALSLDASGGAADMATKLGTNNTAALRNLFLQFPNRTSAVALADASGSRLPVAAGDKVAFVFNINTSINIQETNQAENEITVGGGEGSGALAAALGVANATYGSGSRKAVFYVNVI